jgi:hypothetical protein
MPKSNNDREHLLSFVGIAPSQAKVEVYQTDGPSTGTLVANENDGATNQRMVALSEFMILSTYGIIGVFGETWPDQFH